MAGRCFVPWALNEHGAEFWPARELYECWWGLSLQVMMGGLFSIMTISGGMYSRGMKAFSIQIGAGMVVRHLGFNEVGANRARWGNALSLVCAFLVTLGGLSAQAAAETTYKLFGREVGGYAPNDDVPGIVKKELGPRASVADWNEIKARFGQSEASLKAFCEKIGLAPEGSACVTVSGKRFWQEQRQYFVYRADHNKPEDFLVHDQLQNSFLLLGSWVDQRLVLVKIADYNAADAAKFAKWDETLAGRDKATPEKMKELAGVYALVSVDGKKVPAKVSHEGANLEVRSGRFTIGADGKCSSAMTIVPPTGKEVTVETRATYSLGGKDLNTLNMQWQGAGQTTGTVEGKTFTMDNEGMVFVYKKTAEAAAPAPGATESSPAKIGAAEAKDHYNETLIVTGQVAQVTFRPTVVYLNLDKPFPETPFAVAIFSKDTNGFGDLSQLKGKGVEARGQIVGFRGRAEVVLTNSNQLKVVGGK